jgi:tetratricopeptide (TPR) repeat protein
MRRVCIIVAEVKTTAAPPRNATASETAHRVSEATAAVTRNSGLDPAVLEPIVRKLGEDGVSVEELIGRATEAVASLIAHAGQAVAASKAGPDIDATIAAARACLSRADALGAMALLEAKLAEPDATHGRRILPLLQEQVEIARLAGDAETACAVLERIVALDGANAAAWVALGDIAMTRGRLAEARAAYDSALAASTAAGSAWHASVSLGRIGDIHMARNDLDAALASYDAGVENARRLSGRMPLRAEQAREVSVSLNRIGDIQLARNDLQAAFAAFQAVLHLRRQLAALAPSDAGRARDVSVSLERIGDLALARGDHATALASHQEGLDLRRQLAARAPSQAGRARDVAVSLMKLGDSQLARNDLAAALASCREALAIARKLSAQDSANLQRARDVCLFLARTSQLQEARGDSDEACRSLREAAGLIAQLRLAAPDVHQLQADAELIAALQRDTGCA